MSWLSNLIHVIKDPVSLVLHVPDVDLFTNADAAGVTPTQWRAVEMQQVKYFEGKVIRQAIPRKL